MGFRINENTTREKIKQRITVCESRIKTLDFRFRKHHVKRFKKRKRRYLNEIYRLQVLKSRY